MVCLGVEPGTAGWKAQTNLLSYGGTPTQSYFIEGRITVQLFSILTGLDLLDCLTTDLLLQTYLNLSHLRSVSLTALTAFVQLSFGELSQRQLVSINLNICRRDNTRRTKWYFFKAIFSNKMPQKLILAKIRIKCRFSIKF